MSFLTLQGSVCVCVCVCVCKSVCQGMCVLMYTPIGNGNKGGSIVITGFFGLIKGEQIFSHPVTSWTVPLPALRAEKRREEERRGEKRRLTG